MHIILHNCKLLIGLQVGYKCYLFGLWEVETKRKWPFVVCLVVVKEYLIASVGGKSGN